LTPLHLVCQLPDDDLKLAKLLVDRGANVNAQTTAGLTPLMIACSRGNACLVQYLLSKQAKINQLNNLNESALFIALSKNRFEIAALLIMYGATLEMDMVG
jgi:uncharacterized protein